MNNKIKKASNTDTDRLAISLARAFDDDPVVNWIVRKDKKRTQGLELLFHSCIADLCLRHEQVLMTEDFAGGALWYPPGTSKVGFARQLFLIPKMIPVVGWTGLLRLALAMDKMDRDHPKERHYYLQFIGVVPEHQGSGTGTALMKPILDICDREKCGAFLQSSKEANLAFYGRFGFVVTKKIFPGKGSPPLWLMWRSPRI
ncbi:MAG: GNAT family N-acetyltransferase [Deltaproteobacteria bacterium]|nr:GNAT family N-acetyltransferase [Deltaproteobacteria bacterium]